MKHRNHRLQYIDMHPQPVPITMPNNAFTKFIFSRKFKYFMAVLVLIALLISLQAAVGGAVLGGLILWWNKEI